MFDFGRAAVFLFGTPLLKAQNDCIRHKLGGHDPLGPPGYAYASPSIIFVA